MLKFLLLVAVIGVALWIFKSRKRASGQAPPPAPPNAGSPGAKTGPQTMLACAHCGVHLPQPDALMDVGGRPYCTEAHRLAGPR